MDKLELELAGCLRRLLRSRYVIRSRNERWFKAIIDQRVGIQSAVQYFAATLEVDEALGLAYLRPINEEIEDQLAIRLSRPRVLGPYASALMLKLRQHRLQFYLQPTGDDIPLIALLEMREFLEQFSQARIDNQFERQFRRALDELSELQVILETASESGHFEITALCDLLLPADQIQQLRGRAETYFAGSGQGGDEMIVQGEL